MAKGVVDEVAERLLEPQAVALNAASRPASTAILAAQGKASRDRLEQLVRVDRLALKRQVALLRAREQQQVVGEPREPLGLGGGRPDRRLQLLR